MEGCELLDQPWYEVAVTAMSIRQDQHPGLIEMREMEIVEFQEWLVENDA